MDDQASRQAISLLQNGGNPVIPDVGLNQLPKSRVVGSGNYAARLLHIDSRLLAGPVYGNTIPLKAKCVFLAPCNRFPLK